MSFRLNRLVVAAACASVALVSASSSYAATTVTHGSYQFSGFPEQCSGELIVAGEGTFHETVTSVLTPSGRVVMNFSSHAFATFTTSSGTTYGSRGMTHSHQTYDLLNDSAGHLTTFVHVREVPLESETGDVQGIYVRSLFTITADASGTVREMHVNSEVGCR